MGVDLRGITVHRYRAQPALCARADQQITLYLPRPLKCTTGVGEITRQNKRIPTCNLQRGHAATGCRGRVNMVQGKAACYVNNIGTRTATHYARGKLHRTVVVIKGAAGLRKYRATGLRRANRGDATGRGKGACGQRECAHRQGGGTGGRSNTASSIHRQISGNPP